MDMEVYVYLFTCSLHLEIWTARRAEVEVTTPNPPSLITTVKEKDAPLKKRKEED